MPVDDTELLAAASRGDQAAFDALFARHEADLFRFALHLARQPDAADELYQETWFRAVRHLRRPAAASGVGNVKQWLFTIAANLFRDEIRRRQVRRRVLDDRGGDAAEQQLERIPAPAAATDEDLAIRQSLDRALDRLTDRQRTVFLLCRVEGYKIAQVGRMLRVADGTVKSTLHRAVEILREEMRDFRH